MTADAVARLDYSKPPPGYAAWTFRGASIGGQVYQTAEGEQVGTLKMAWGGYKTENDPPGYFVDGSVPNAFFVLCKGRAVLGPFTARTADDYGVVERLPGPAPVRTRAYAWAWHDRRLALVARLEDEGVQLDMWPHALTWTDGECAECERWPGMRALPDDFPAVLRRLAEDARLVENLGGPDHIVVGEPGRYEVVCPEPACCSTDTATFYRDRAQAEAAARAADEAVAR